MTAPQPQSLTHAPLPDGARPTLRVHAGRYAVALALVAAGLGARWLLDPWLGPAVPYLQFIFWILAAAWYAGFGPALVTTAGSALAAMYFALPPDGFAVAGLHDVVSLLLFCGTGFAIAAIVRRLRLAESAERAEAGLATARAERLDAIINTTVDAIIVTDDGGLIDTFSHSAERMFGYRAAEVRGQHVRVLMAPSADGHEYDIGEFVEPRATPVGGLGREVAGRRRDGTTFPLHVSAGEMRIGSRRMFTSLLHDLSARAELRDRLQASEERWRAIIDSAVDGVVVIDDRGQIEAFNPAAERLFGFRADEVIGRNVSLLMPSPHREQHDRYLARYLATGEARVIGIGREVPGRRKDGTIIPVHLSVGRLDVKGAPKFTGIVHDLTARVRLEQQMRDQEALARVGEMAAVLAHEIKNPLAGIRGVLEIVRDAMPAGAPDAELASEAIARVDSLDVMMRELLLFARPPQPRPELTDLVPLLTATARLLRRDRALDGVDIRVEGMAPPVFVDAEMLKIVVQNLLLNSADAMRGHGRIDVAVDVDGDGQACRIRLTDTGPGIPTDIRARIFTPFFTTKSRGTGLGLPTAKRFVEAHAGQIAVDCPEAGGTTIVVTLPVDGRVASTP